MTVTTSPFLTLGAFNLSSVSSFMGQGTDPELWALWSFSGVQTDPPVWVNLGSDRVRDFSVTRGRESELQDFDAGTATITLSNRDRAFDPTYSSSPYYPNVRPRNRCWLRAQFNGATYDLFKGYVDSYDQQQPAPGQSDAVCVVQASDEFKMLNLRKTRAMDPPDAADYVGVVGADNPSHVWRWRDEFLTTTTIVDEAG